jgi:hypothetical protein
MAVSHRFLLLLPLLAACAPRQTGPSSPPVNALKITDSGPLTGIPSASGLEAWNGRYWVIGDDSPWLFAMDSRGRLLEKWPLLSDTVPDIIPKALKPDLEAICLAILQDGPRLLIFGSGSRSPRRDLLLLVDPHRPDAPERFALSAFYVHLRTMAGLAEGELNLEGAVARGDTLWLLNRGRPLIFRCSLSDLFRHLQDQGALPETDVRSFELPALEGLPVTFTGATGHPDGHHLLFCAAVEDSPDAYDDGRVLGSFIGALDPLAATGSGPLWCLPVTDQEGQRLAVKVESLALLPVDPGAPGALLMVTDSDGGPSLWLRAQMPELR